MVSRTLHNNIPVTYLYHYRGQRDCFFFNNIIHAIIYYYILHYIIIMLCMYTYIGNSLVLDNNIIYKCVIRSLILITIVETRRCVIRRFRIYIKLWKHYVSHNKYLPHSVCYLIIIIYIKPAIS